MGLAHAAAKTVKLAILEREFEMAENNKPKEKITIEVVKGRKLEGDMGKLPVGEQSLQEGAVEVGGHSSTQEFTMCPYCGCIRMIERAPGTIDEAVVCTNCGNQYWA